MERLISADPAAYLESRRSIVVPPAMAACVPTGRRPGPFDGPRTRAAAARLPCGGR